MRKHSVYLFFLFLLFSNFQCFDCEEELHGKSSYTAELIPQQVNYNIGDTILLGTSFSALIPYDDNKTIYDNANEYVSFIVQIFEVKPNNETIVDGIEDFEISTKTGLISNGRYYEKRMAIEIIDTCGIDTCGFQIEVVPQKKGIYCFSLLNSSFGGLDCQYVRMDDNNFGLFDNNFDICNEINTDRFRILEDGRFYLHPEVVKSFYFFKVE